MFWFGHRPNLIIASPETNSRPYIWVPFKKQPSHLIISTLRCSINYNSPHRRSIPSNPVCTLIAPRGYIHPYMVICVSGTCGADFVLLDTLSWSPQTILCPAHSDNPASPDRDPAALADDWGFRRSWGGLGCSGDFQYCTGLLFIPVLRENFQ